MNFIDTHCHIFSEYYSDIPAVLKEAQAASVSHFFVCGCNTKSNKEILFLIHTYNEIYGVLGIHPEEASIYTEDDLKFLEEHLHEKKVLAIGEIGLDYHYTKENKKEQIILFEKQLALAQKYNLPVVIHSRDATQDTIASLKKFKVHGVIHSFSGSYETAEIYLHMGFLLGINGVVTFKNSHIIDVIKRLSPSAILLETDCPYLTPHPFRGSKNAPKYISVIAKFLSDELSISLEDLSKITNENVHRIFDKYDKI